DPVEDAAVAGDDGGADLLGLAGDREQVEDLVVDQGAHLLPAALLGQVVEGGGEIGAAVEGQRLAVGRGRGVEGDLEPDGRLGGGQLLVAVAGDHEYRGVELDVG